MDQHQWMSTASTMLGAKASRRGSRKVKERKEDGFLSAMVERVLANPPKAKGSRKAKERRVRKARAKPLAEVKEKVAKIEMLAEFVANKVIGATSALTRHRQ